MKLLKLLFVLLMGVSLSMATSCNKDDDDNDNNDGGDNPPAPTKCYIKKSINDDSTYTVLEYNSDHKVTKVTDYKKDGSVEGVTFISYNSDGMMNMFVMVENGDTTMKMKMSHSGTKLDSTDLFVDMGAGLKMFSRFVYVYNGNKLAAMLTKADPLGTGFVVVSKNEYTFNGDNVSMIKEMQMDVTSGTFKLNSTTEYTYDDKKNPYVGIGVDYLMGEAQFISVNNPLKMTYKDDTGTVDNDESEDYTYEYNSNGYPTKVTAKSFSGSSTDVTTNEYDCK
jgi:hypothetical protein